jgi:hypothetical protein
MKVRPLRNYHSVQHVFDISCTVLIRGLGGALSRLHGYHVDGGLTVRR